MSIATPPAVTFRPPFDLEDVRVLPGNDREVRVEPTAKRVRAFFGEIAIADSTRVQIVSESGRLPVYYFPVDDVRMDLMVPGERTETSPHRGTASYLNIDVGQRRAADAAWRYLDAPAGVPDLTGLVAFHWRAMDAWYEEDEEVFTHARDPHHRIDVLRSSRHVEVLLGGAVVASTRNSRMLFETSLPVRYYLPPGDVRLDLLQPSERVSACAYKGQTSRYWSAGDPRRDVAWSYEHPSDEVAKIAGLISFFNERVEVRIDGVVQPRLDTPWS